MRNCAAVTATVLPVLFSALLFSAVPVRAQAPGTPFCQAIRDNDISALRDLIRTSGVDTRDRRGRDGACFCDPQRGADAVDA
jgi:hypothetical protein